MLNNSCPTDDPNLIYALTRHNDMADTACSQRGPNFNRYLQEEQPAHRIRMLEPDRDEQSPCLYARLRTLLHHQDKPSGLPTPPASPRQPSDLGSASAPRDQIYSSPTNGSPVLASSEDASPAPSQCAPLTPESIGHRFERGSGSWQSLVRLVQDFTFGEQGAEFYSEEGLIGCDQQLLDDLEAETRTQFSDQGEKCIEMNSTREAVPLKQDGLVDKGEGVHLMEEDGWVGRPRTTNIQWGKSQAPPIVRVGLGQSQVDSLSFAAMGRLDR